MHRIEVTGDLDHYGAQALRRALDDAVVQRPERIDVDLTGATFFCCAAVTALVTARNANDGRLVLIGAGPTVRTVLDLLGLTATFRPPPPTF